MNKKIGAAVMAAALLTAPQDMDAQPAGTYQAQTPHVMTIEQSTQDDSRTMAQARWLYKFLIRLGAIVTAVAAGWHFLKNRTRIGRFISTHGGWKLVAWCAVIMAALAGGVALYMTANPELWKDAHQRIATLLAVIGAGTVLWLTWQLRGLFDRRHASRSQTA